MPVDRIVLRRRDRRDPGGAGAQLVRIRARRSIAGRSSKSTVAALPVVTTTSWMAGENPSRWTATWWRPGVVHTISPSGVLPTCFPSTVISAPSVAHVTWIWPSLVFSSAAERRASASVSGGASPASRRKRSNAATASTGRPRSRFAWPMLNHSFGLGKIV
jgi:hypothetical protein